MLTVLAGARPVGAATFAEEFSTDPATHGWQNFGNTNLFRWDATNQNLRVTWDSSQTNSYFHWPLGTIMTRGDDFALELDLVLEDILGGVNPGKPHTFELAFGFQNFEDARQTNFFRGGGHALNLAEFTFFPEADTTATLWPSLWSTNRQLNYNGDADYTLLDLPVGPVMHIGMAYTAGDETLVTTVTTNGVAIGSINSVALSPAFTDFRLGTFALASYSDAGQDARFGGSLLAHGIVDNIVLTVPPAPISNLAGGFSNGGWQVTFESHARWQYDLERSSDLRSWTSVASAAPGAGGQLTLLDPSLSSSNAWYRVAAQRP